MFQEEDKKENDSEEERQYSPVEQASLYLEETYAESEGNLIRPDEAGDADSLEEIIRDEYNNEVQEGEGEPIGWSSTSGRAKLKDGTSLGAWGDQNDTGEMEDTGEGAV